MPKRERRHQAAPPQNIAPVAHQFLSHYPLARQCSTLRSCSAQSVSDIRPEQYPPLVTRIIPQIALSSPSILFSSSVWQRLPWPTAFGSQGAKRWAGWAVAVRLDKATITSASAGLISTPLGVSEMLRAVRVSEPHHPRRGGLNRGSASPVVHPTGACVCTVSGTSPSSCVDAEALA